MNNWDVLGAGDQAQLAGISEAELIGLITQGKVQTEAKIRPAGTEEWRPITSEAQFAALLPNASVSATHPEVSPAKTIADKVPLRKKAQKKPQSSYDDSMIPLPSDDPLAVRSGSTRMLAEMDMTPMVDLTFLLNMFFILTTSYALMQTLRLPPVPPQQADAVTEPIQPPGALHIIVRVERDGSYLVDDLATKPDDLTSRINDTRNLTRKSMAIVDCHPEAPIDAMVRVIDAASAAKLEKVKIPTKLRGVEQL